jgi:hypothetical protein
VWKRVWLDIPIHNDNIQDAMASKELRCCPERFPELAGYDYLCWIDSKMRISNVDNVMRMLDILVSSDMLVAATKHPLPYTTVWGEYEAAIQYPKYAQQKESYKQYIEEQIAKGADPNKPLRICSGFRLMKMNERRKILGETWLSHIQQCGIECQISWQFIHQLYEDAVVFPYSLPV